MFNKCIAIKHLDPSIYSFRQKIIGCATEYTTDFKSPNIKLYS